MLSPASAAAENRAGIWTAAWSDQKLPPSVPLVRTASVNAVPRRMAVVGSWQPRIGSHRALDQDAAPSIRCGSNFQTGRPSRAAPRLVRRNRSGLVVAETLAPRNRMITLPRNPDLPDRDRPTTSRH